MSPSSSPQKDPLSGRVGHLDPGQQHILGKFKKELEAEGLYKSGPPATHDDPTLLRFLRARKFDLQKAKLMFSECEKWRKDFHVDELYAKFDYHEKEAVDKSAHIRLLYARRETIKRTVYPQFYHKTDKDGRPIYIEQLGNLDLNKLYQVTTPERQIQRLVVEYEKFLRERLPVCTALREDGERVETSCTIMDLDGVGISQFWKVKNYVQRASHIGQYYYPETMGKFYIVNAPYLFSTVWSFVKPWLDEVTVRKIAILSHSQAKSALLDNIPAENLPTNLGEISEGKLDISMDKLEAAAGGPEAAKAIADGKPVLGLPHSTSNGSVTKAAA